MQQRAVKRVDTALPTVPTDTNTDTSVNKWIVDRLYLPKIDR